MFFIFAWLKENQDGNSFEEQVPLLFLGNYLRRQGSNEIFNIVFLDGYHQLSSHYISELKAVGFNVINFSREFQRLARGFPGLARFGKYEMFCFLRWQTLAEYLRVENTRGQVFQIDGDIVFNAKPEEVANDAKGLTFAIVNRVGKREFFKIPTAVIDQLQSTLKKRSKDELYSRK